MLLIREIMYCKPGKVRPLVDKFLKMNELGKKIGWLFPAKYRPIEGAFSSASRVSCGTSQYCR